MKDFVFSFRQILICLCVILSSLPDRKESTMLCWSDQEQSDQSCYWEPILRTKTQIFLRARYNVGLHLSSAQKHAESSIFTRIYIIYTDSTQMEDCFVFTLKLCGLKSVSCPNKNTWNMTLPEFNSFPFL